MSNRGLVNDVAIVGVGGAGTNITETSLAG